MAANTHVADLESGSSQYFSRADGSELSITGNLTLEGWFRLESAPGTDATFGLISKWETSGDQRSYDLSYRDESGTKRLVVALSSSGTEATTVEGRFDVTLSTGTWYHIAIVYTASAGTVAYYINGVLQETDTGFNGSIFNSTQTLEIGRRLAGSYYDGTLDMIRVWNVTRTATEIQDAMSRELGATTGLAAEWLLNNNENDNSGNALTLTNNNVATFATTNLPPVTIAMPVSSVATSHPALVVSLSQTVSMPVTSVTISHPALAHSVSERSIANVDKSSAGTWTTLNKS